jgi:hypothetical protein
MAKKEYKTASGKRIDFDTMQLKGEEVIAVGNMGVNARGDKLGTGGTVEKTREEVMADYYRIHNGTIPEDRPIPDPDDDPAGPMDAQITADAAPSIQADEIENDTITSDDLAKALAETATEVETVTPEPESAPDQAPQVVARQKELASKSETEKEAVQVAEQIMEEDKEILEKLEDTPTEKPTVKIADEEQIDPEPAVEEVKQEKPSGGLASAVAKVQTTKPVVKEKTAQQKEKDKGGVKRL